MRPFLISLVIVSAALCANAQDDNPKTPQASQSKQAEAKEAPNGQTGGHAETEENAQPEKQQHRNDAPPDGYPVKIISQPPDKWFSPPVIIAVVAAFIGLGTLGAIWVQTIHAGKQVDAVMNAERAWLWTSLNWVPGNSRVSYDVEGNGRTSAVVRIVCVNAGRTPGQILEGRIGITILNPPLPESLDFASARQVLDAHGTIRVGETSYWDRVVDCEGVADMTRQTAVIYGVIPYLDVFGKRREATFGFEALESMLGQINEKPYNKNS
jgi:hypothetical protein